MGRAWRTNWEKKNAYMLLVGNPEVKSSLGRPRCRREDNVKMDLYYPSLSITSSF
jgi:hypothetical protein